MNVFEHLGLQADHRKGQKITQHVKHIDEVPESKKPWPMYVQIKKDGVYALVAKTAHGTHIFSRTGKQYTNVEELEQEIDKYKHGYGMDNAVYIAELCNPTCSLEELSGMVNPNRKKALTGDQLATMEHTYLEYHDAVSIEAFKNGYSPLPYVERYIWTVLHVPTCFTVLDLHVVNTEEEARVYANDVITDGEEGIVLKQYATTGFSDWEAGHKGYRMMKIVRGVDFDLLCVDTEEGTGKYAGKIANLHFQWKDGGIVQAMLGKGWTHDMAEDMFNNLATDSPVGKIFQVYALQESSKGLLRLPKVGELRHDKTEPDV
jgi:ATP-dependent DNA ligase